MSSSEYIKRTIIKEKIQSTFLEEYRNIRIYLPPGFNDLISYPILYTQDGQDTFFFGRITSIANYLILEEGLEPFIIVGVDVVKGKRTSEYSPAGRFNQQYKKFFAEELIPFVESKYEIRRDGIKRLLIGDSLGGTVSLDLCLDYPQLFQHLISLSGAYFETSLARIQLLNDLSWLNLWMIVGLQETEVKTDRGTFNFLDWNREAKEALEQRNVNLRYIEREGVHTWGFWQKVLPEAISHFLK